jgi:hypothetical protein
MRPPCSWAGLAPCYSCGIGRSGTCQSNLRSRGAQIAGGVAGVSTDHPWLNGTGSDRLATWLDAWWRSQRETPEDDRLAALASALEAQMAVDQQVAGEVALLLQQGYVIPIVLDALQGQAEHQTQLLQMLAEDLQKATYRNERLHAVRAE